MTGEKSKKTDLVKINDKYLEKSQGIGMSGVDPNDIRPPAILLTQKLSDLSAFQTAEGKQPKVGQFFHTGKLEIYSEFECYFLFAAKSKYTDKRKPHEGEKYQYRVLGALVDDCSLFGMVFKSSSFYALSSLFGFARNMNRPMYSIRCKVETKILKNDQAEWFVPVVRIAGPEKDEGKLMILDSMARSFEVRGNEVVEEPEKEEEPPTPDDVH